MDVGSSPALALDARGMAYIAYVSPAGIKVGHEVGEGWRITLVDGEPGNPPALAIDSRGALHLAYTGGGRLKYAVRRRSGDWSITVLDTLAYGPVGLALNGNGVPRIAYTTYRQGLCVQVRYAFASGDSWKFEIVREFPFVDFVALAIGAVDVPYVLYDTDRVLTCSSRVGGVWDRIPDFPYPDCLISASIAIDILGNPRVVFSGRETGGSGLSDESVKQIVRSGETWTVELVDSTESGRGYSLVIDAAGRSRVSYRIGDQLRLARQMRSGAWRVRTLRSAGPVFGITSMALDARGDTRIAYGGADGVRYIALGDEGHGRESAESGDDPDLVTAIAGGGVAITRDQHAAGSLGVSPCGAFSRPLNAWPMPYPGGQLNVSFVTSQTAGPPSESEIAVYDLAGRRLRTLARGSYLPGEHRVSWDGRDEAGRAASSGMMFLRLTDGAAVRYLKIARVP